MNHIVENWDTLPQRIKDLKKQGSTQAKKTKKAATTLANQTVAIPWDKAAARCENLDEPGNLIYALKNGVLTITVPKLSAHACVVVTE